jgi:ABC-2 type transport system ATP-binding protein
MTLSSRSDTVPFPANAPEAAILLEGLRKTYGGPDQPEALCGVDLCLPRGSLFGLLGPNGAGKSTLINTLGGLVVKSAGVVNVWGYDLDENPRAVRSSIGIVPQELNLDAFFTTRQMLDVQAGLYNVPRRERRTDQLLEIFDLTPYADRSTRALSGGMRRRLMVAKAMVHRPPVLVLDEPTAGVDVELRHGLWDYLRRLNALGTTILLTTHYLEEAEMLCDRIAILDHGQVIANAAKDDLLTRIDQKTVVITVDRDLVTVPANLRAFGWVLVDRRHLSLTYKPSGSAIGRILLAVQVNGLGIVDLSTKEPTLEDVFLHLTGAEADEPGKEAASQQARHQ